jgi:NOL1/NOP2/fmu family ribosome biogenesis protein
MARNPQDEIDRCRDWLQFRFGIPVGVFDRLIIYQPNRKRLFCYPKGLQFLDLQTESIGFGLAKTRMQQPKLATSAVRVIGHLATRNFVDLSRDQVRSYFQRLELTLPQDAAPAIDGPGQVIVRYQQQPVGLGMWFYQADYEARLTSLFPKNWASQLGVLSN